MNAEKLDWASLDWRGKKNPQIAAETGYSYSMVAKMRTKYFKRPFRKEMKIDFSLRNKDLSEIYGVPYNTIASWRHICGGEKHNNLKGKRYKINNLIPFSNFVSQRFNKSS